jgi:pimeloyl-ACP methyl ester carboxylesterase
VLFSDRVGDELRGTYYPGSQPAGILLLTGFGSDQVTMRSAAVEFAQAGVHVFGFDFSGHGRSSGSLGFDNAATDRLAHQLLAALEEFKRLSGLGERQIILMGHSMGARVALQAAAGEQEPVAGLILLGASVNLATNVQSEVFTGVTDADLPWVLALGPDNPPVDILLVTGRWDDILTPENARLLLSRLVGADAVEFQFYGEEGAGRQLIILERLLHNYEVFSPRALGGAKAWAGEIWQLEELAADAPTAAWRIVWWLVALVGIFGAVVGGAHWAALSPLPIAVPRIGLTSRRRFLWSKLLLWLAALPLAGLILGASFLVPLGVPVFNLIYVGFIGGYGLLMLALYALGRMPGTQGRLPFAEPDGERAPAGRVGLALSATAGLLVLTAVFARTGWFLVPPVSTRFVWLLLLTPLTALGFWIGRYEDEMLAADAPGKVRPRLAAALIGLFPFFLLTVFQAAIGSLSGMVAGLQGLLILALVTFQGTLLQRIAGRPWLTAFCQAVLLYWLVLPQGVLFST